MPTPASARHVPSLASRPAFARRVYPPRLPPGHDMPSGLADGCPRARSSTDGAEFAPASIHRHARRRLICPQWPRARAPRSRTSQASGSAGPLLPRRVLRTHPITSRSCATGSGATSERVRSTAQLAVVTERRGRRAHPHPRHGGFHLWGSTSWWRLVCVPSAPVSRRRPGAPRLQRTVRRLDALVFTSLTTTAAWRPGPCARIRGYRRSRRGALYCTRSTSLVRHQPPTAPRSMRSRAVRRPRRRLRVLRRRHPVRRLRRAAHACGRARPGILRTRRRARRLLPELRALQPVGVRRERRRLRARRARSRRRRGSARRVLRPLRQAAAPIQPILALLERTMAAVVTGGDVRPPAGRSRPRHAGAGPGRGARRCARCSRRRRAMPIPRQRRGTPPRLHARRAHRARHFPLRG